MKILVLRLSLWATLLVSVPAHAAVVSIDESGFAGTGPILDFEEFTPNSDVVDIQFDGFGVTFTSLSGGWPVEPHSDYGDTFEAAALAEGAGSQGLFHLNESESIQFNPPVTRVGFLFGSNVDVDVPITLRRGGQPIEATNLVVSANDLAFFGFEDLQGIDQIDFGTELNSGFVSQLDNLRFEREPTGAVSLVGPAGFSDTEAVLDFEQFVPNVDVVSGQFSGLGATFASTSGGWPVEPHDDYGLGFADAALAAGAGVQGLFHVNDQEEILFDPPVKRIGFQFGSNVDVRVPVTLHRGVLEVGSTELLVADDQLPFYGFQDPQGIDRIAFGTELNSGFVSQLDNLRFERIDTIAEGDISQGRPRLDFESFTPDQSVVSNQFAGHGVSFGSLSGGWPVESYSDYGQTLAGEALAVGAGVQGLFHTNDGEEILFDPPADQVGFLFGSNVDVRVPILLFRDGVQTGSFEIGVGANQLDFFGFADDQGIDAITFGTELNSAFVSQLDNVRFQLVPEPGRGSLAAAAGATLLLLALRRRSRARLR